VPESLLKGVLLACALGSAAAAAQFVPVTIEGDAIAQSLTQTPGDPARGRSIVASRQTGLCLLCHAAPIPEERFQGNLAPDLAGAGARYTPAQLRLRVVDSRVLNPASLMPAFHREVPLSRVGRAWTGRPILQAQDVEDVVAYLATLK